MRTVALITMLAVGCGGASKQAPSSKLMHSPELNGIMKNEVNQPFSALMFLVFHGDGDDVDFGRISAPVATLREGVFKVRAIVDPPVMTAEARSVFFTYVDSMVRDSDQLSEAVTRRDRGRTEKLLTKISNTCTNCHRFFRLKEIEAAQ